MAILYTEAQVENALLRAMVAMYEISETIQSGFYYMYSPQYATYKTLQYDIYVLFTVIADENPYCTYSPNPSVYEAQFYQLVGSLINKTKQFDVFGQFGGTVNPNYQSNGSVTIVVDGSGTYTPPIYYYSQADLIDADPPNGNWYLEFVDENGDPIYNEVPVSVISNGASFSFTFDQTFNPARIYGFATNATQTIEVTAA